jgi:hypothetical protein
MQNADQGVLFELLVYLLSVHVVETEIEEVTLIVDGEIGAVWMHNYKGISL